MMVATPSRNGALVREGRRAAGGPHLLQALAVAAHAVLALEASACGGIRGMERVKGQKSDISISHAFPDLPLAPAQPPVPPVADGWEGSSLTRPAPRRNTRSPCVVMHQLASGSANMSVHHSVVRAMTTLRAASCRGTTQPAPSHYQSATHPQRSPQMRAGSPTEPQPRCWPAWWGFALGCGLWSLIGGPGSAPGGKGESKVSSAAPTRCLQLLLLPLPARASVHSVLARPPKAGSIFFWQRLVPQSAQQTSPAAWFWIDSTQSCVQARRSGGSNAAMCCATAAPPQCMHKLTALQELSGARASALDCCDDEEASEQAIVDTTGASCWQRPPGARLSPPAAAQRCDPAGDLSMSSDVR